MIEAVSLLPLSAAILSAALIVTAGLAPRRRTLAWVFFLALNVSTLLWSLAYFMQLNWGSYVDPALAVYDSPDYALIWLTSLGVAGAPTYWFLFAAADARRAFWTSGRGIALAHVPLLYTIAVSVTNPSHRLFLAEGPNGLQTYGPLAPPHFAATFLLVGAGIYLIVARPLSSGTATGRRRALMLGGATLLTMAGGVFFAVRLLANDPLPINPTPVLFPLVNLVLAYQVMRGELGDIVPLSTLSSIMENTDAHLAFLGREYTILSANSAFIRRSGHSEAELLGHGYFELFPDPSREELFDRVRDTGEALERHADRSHFRESSPRSVSYWDWSLSPVTDSSGELQGLVLSLLDVTESIRERELSDTLNELSGRVHAGFASDEALCSAIAAAADAIGCESSAIAMRRDDQWRVMQHCERPGASWEPFSTEDFPHVALAIRAAATVGVEDTLNDERLNPYMMKALGVRAALVVPLLALPEPEGALAFNVHSAPTRFSPAQVDFAQRLASVVTLASENARMYQSERMIAVTLQESMLNVPRKIRGVEFGHAYRSASESALVGGDFYDLFEIDDRRVAILIGDVSGKGIEAAVTTSLIKNTIRASAYEEPSPAAVLNKTNEIVRVQTEIELFATAFLAVLEHTEGAITYASAGHPPALLLAPGGEVRLLAEHSTLLGTFENTTFDETVDSMAPGEVLVLYTDGVTEARRDGRMLGEQGLEEILRGATGRSPEEVVRAVFDGVLRFTHGQLSDDLALLAIRLAQQEPAR
ncbi:MAG: SpoIIE family protein phosphatase [Coriobacteriia bacterium]|nr:SpoIIE family protein phosphatase [Coriobacteriia bacterium]